MEKLKVKIMARKDVELPRYTSEEASGMDVAACLDQPMTIQPMQRALVPTGLKMQIPRDYECQIRPRSGLALNHGITVLNTPGTIDADSRAELGVILINLSNEPFTIKHGDRIAQMVFKSCIRIDWDKVDEIDKTKRGTGAFGDSGLA